MRPNWINPPKIEKTDQDKPLIEQIDEMYWEPHDQRMRHCFNLSRWHLEFCGKLIDYTDHTPRYASYNTDIFDENSYPRYVGTETVREEWNEASPKLSVELASMHNETYVGIGEHRFAIVGNIIMSCHVFRLRPKPISGFENILAIDNLKHYICTELEEAYGEDKGAIFPQSANDIAICDLKGRPWLHAHFGLSKTRLRHTLYTALDDSHLICVYYQPHFWSRDCREISEKAYKISLTPLWDFMDNLSIEEIQPADSEKYITGKVAPENTETFKHPGQDDNTDIEW